MAKLLLDKTKHGWWESAVFYQIYPKSFQDTDGDENTPPNTMRSVSAVWPGLTALSASSGTSTSLRPNSLT